MLTHKKRIGLTIPEHLYLKLKERSKYEGKTLNGLILDILWTRFYENEETQHKAGRGGNE